MLAPIGAYGVPVIGEARDYGGPGMVFLRAGLVGAQM